MRWRPEDLDRLERAIDEGTRVQLSRRGTEYVIVPRTLETEGATEVIVAVHPGTGEEMRFPLDEIDSFTLLA
ncbi:MAG TPA: hypothetical protein VHG28_15660 [Longimicrobiaceae bacterium]|nr:hypothetical protein [Longimicrobiaceae bacterium]